MTANQGRLLLLAAAMSSACSGGQAQDASPGEIGETGESRDAVQAAYVDGNNQFGTTFATNLLTTGSSNVHGALIAPAQGSVPGWTCGATFISKHYAITAAHCVDGSAATGNPTAFAYEPSGGFTVRQIDTSNLNLFAAYLASTLTGTSNPNGAPSWTPGYTLSSADGYNVTNMTCRVKYRCDSTYGTRTCPPFTANADVALIHCTTRSATGYVSVSTSEPANGTNVSMAWFHEILNLATSSGDTTHNVPSGNWVNYGKYVEGQESKNYHYTNASSNQLLPMAFLSWPGGTAYRTVAHFSDETWTDVPACHGTSGSGTFVNGTSTLLGPVSHASMGDVLCFDMPNATHGAQNSSFANATFVNQLNGTSVVQADK